MTELSKELRRLASGPMCRNPENTDTCNTLLLAAAQTERLQQWVNDLQSGMYINCVYCGHRYGPRDNTPSTMADILTAHVETCVKHPLSRAREEIEQLQRHVMAGTRCNFVGVPCGNCVGCKADKDIFEAFQ